ncbi:MAG: efflux RND transporter periplasmic adaptor subunit [Bacteroidota bacterium]
MKKIFLIPGLALLMVACNSGTDKKTELENLKKQESELKSKIAVLESELNQGNDSVATGIAVAVVSLKPETFKNYIDVQGRVDADENVGISTEMPGTITKINVKVGDQVSKGQVLAETDARSINQSIADLQVNTALVNQIFEKQKNLWEQKIGTEVQFLQAKTNKESMETKMSMLQQQLSMSKIVSPISGTVDAVDVKLGQMVAPGMPAIRVINFDNLKVKADVAETYASKIKKGSEVVVYFPDMNDSMITKVNFVARAINQASRTFLVEVLLDNKKEYHPNMVARLNVNDYSSAAPAIVVPVRTIQKDENNANFVFVAENGIAQKRIITIGKEYSGKAEIKSGLKENDLLVTLGYDIINEGDAIAYKK